MLMTKEQIRGIAIQDFDDQRELTSFENFKDIYEDVDTEDFSKYMEYLLLFSKPDLARDNDMRCPKSFFRPALRLINEIQYEFKKRTGLEAYLQMWHPKWNNSTAEISSEDTASGIYIYMYVYPHPGRKYDSINVVSYACPTQIKRPDHPAYIPFNADIADIDKYVDRMVKRFVEGCKKKNITTVA